MILMPIYEYKKGGKVAYYYAFEVKDQNGKRKTIKKRGFKGKTEARNAEREAKLEWEKGTYIDPNKVLFGEFITDWLEKKNDISLETRYTNQGHIKNHIIPSIGRFPLQKITVNHIENFILDLQKKDISDATVRKIFNLVHTCFKTAHRKEIIAKNPFDLLDNGSKPKISKPKVDYWTKEEVKLFFSKLDHRHRIMLILAIYTGMRRGEILALRWQDVDFENNQLRVYRSSRPMQGITKSVKTESGYRTITVSSFVNAELKRHCEMIQSEKELFGDDYQDNDLIVCQPNGKQLTLGNFTRFWKTLIKNTGMRYIRFHDLRHTCASLLLSTGVHPKVVQEMLGHSSIRVTLDKYSHMMPNMQAEAADALENLLKE